MANEEEYWKLRSEASHITFRSIPAVLRRRRLVAMTAFLLVLLIVAGSGMWRPEYEAEMKILVRRQRLDAVVTPQANVTPQINGDPVSEEDLNSEVELLNSQDLLRKVVVQTGLAGAQGLPSAGAGDESRRVARASRALGKQIAIEPIRKTNMISVRYKSHDPETVTRVLDALAAAYLTKHLELERPTGEFSFFNQQRDQYRQSLARVQEQLRNFSKTNGVVSAQMERDFALQRMNSFDASAEEAHTRAAELDQRIRTLEAKLGSTEPRRTTLIRTSENPLLMQQLKSTLLTLELKRTELLTKYQSGYPLVREADDQIAEAKASIAAEQEKPISESTTDQDPDYVWIRGELTRAQTELSGLLAREADARSEARQARTSGSNLDQLGMTQQNLLNQEKTDEENFLLYERKAEEARISDALDQRGILNVAVAEQPLTPSLPVHGPLWLAAITAFLAVFISLSAAFLVEFLAPLLDASSPAADHRNQPVASSAPKSYS